MGCFYIRYKHYLWGRFAKTNQTIIDRLKDLDCFHHNCIASALQGDQSSCAAPTWTNLLPGASRELIWNQLSVRSLLLVNPIRLTSRWKGDNCTDWTPVQNCTVRVLAGPHLRSVCVCVCAHSVFIEFVFLLLLLLWGWNLKPNHRQTSDLLICGLFLRRELTDSSNLSHNGPTPAWTRFPDLGDSHSAVSCLLPPPKLQKEAV